MAERRRSWWGWGWEDAAVDAAGLDRLAARVRPWLPGTADPLPPPPVPDLPPPTVEPPRKLARQFTADPRERAGHAMGKAYRDVMRALRGDLPRAPDLVAYPRTDDDVLAVYDWAVSNRVAIVPYGGGSSVVGGVEYDPRNAHRAVVSLDLARMSGVREIDADSRAARIGAGTLGPAIEDGLRLHGLTLRHFPQSFEFSTLGGWIATRSAGHYATGPTRIDDHVQALRVVTAHGTVQTRRLPSSGAGPDPNALFLGSEGALGVITEAWVRVRPRPDDRAGRTVQFADEESAVAAVREIVQEGLRPANCRLLDAAEGVLFAGVQDGTVTVLLAFESAGAPLAADLAHALDICAAHGGQAQESESIGESWREGFLQAPYLRDGLARLGMIVETFETACTWAAFPELRALVTAAAVDAVNRVCGGGVVTMRLTHAYPDGPAPYFTVVAPGRAWSEVSMWDAIKEAVSDAILAASGTITHHHAVGRDHGPSYRREQSDIYLDALAAAKRAVDPAGILNPGVLMSPRGA